jgi:type IV pilus assembly protein PilX
MPANLRKARLAPPRRQGGIALVVALLLLVVITLVGFAAVRGTIMQQRMAANQYDRQIAFQSAEAGLRAAMLRIGDHPDEVARNCRAGGVVCLSNPFNDPNLPAGKIHDVETGTETGQFTAAAVAASQPQYVIENMGDWADPDADTGFGQNASSHNYGVSGGSTTAVYYRITARSGNPDAVGDRAVVILQTVVKQS